MKIFFSILMVLFCVSLFAGFQCVTSPKAFVSEGPHAIGWPFYSSSPNAITLVMKMRVDSWTKPDASYCGWVILDNPFNVREIFEADWVDNAVAGFMIYATGVVSGGQKLRCTTLYNNMTQTGVYRWIAVVTIAGRTDLSYFYQDGVQQPTTVVTNTLVGGFKVATGNDLLRLATTYTTAVGPSAFSFSDFRMYNRALSSSELNEIYIKNGSDSIVNGLVSHIIGANSAPSDLAPNAGSVVASGNYNYISDLTTRRRGYYGNGSR